MTATPTPFKVQVSDEKLGWINERVRTANIIPDVEHAEGKEWEDGVPSSVASEYAEFWRNSYDWRAEEARINATFDMFTVPIEEGGETIQLHFVHNRSKHASAVPLLFAHGWPGNFMEVSSRGYNFSESLTRLVGGELAEVDRAGGGLPWLPHRRAQYPGLHILFVSQGRHPPSTVCYDHVLTLLSVTILYLGQRFLDLPQAHEDPGL